MQIKEAQAGTITADMQRVADDEHISAEVLRERIAAGHCIISRNINHANAVPLGVGRGLRTKINANIGTSKDCVNLDDELKSTEAKGIQLIDKEGREGAAGKIAFLHPKSVNGVLVELVQPRDEGE